MAFLAYSAGDRAIRISYAERDATAGVLGVIIGVSQPPIGQSETRDGITEIAYAFLGRDPTDAVYVTDSQNRLLEIVLNDKYHKDLEAQATWHCMAWALLFLCLVAFVGTVLLDLHWVGVALFLGIAVLYIGCVRLGVQNEVESALLCTILLVLILALIPHIMEMRQRRQNRVPADEARAHLSVAPRSARMLSACATGRKTATSR